MSNKQQEKVQVTDVLTHGHGHGSFVYLQYGQYSCDSNQTIIVLVKCLREISPLPSIYRWTTENKNKYVLAFLAHLVQSGTFRKVMMHAYYLLLHTDFKN